jgi:hypothetical protein
MKNTIKCPECGNTNNVYTTEYCTVAKTGIVIRCFNKGCKVAITPHPPLTKKELKQIGL